VRGEKQIRTEGEEEVSGGVGKETLKASPIKKACEDIQSNASMGKPGRRKDEKG